FNDTVLSYEPVRLEEMFFDEVKTHPEKTALIMASGKEMTYRELDERANALAWYLIDKGVKKGSLVGVMCSRDESLFISLLGILKSGGAYVPIDPTFPSERITYMLHQSDADVLICTSGSKTELSFDGHIIDNQQMVNMNVRQDRPKIADGVDSLATVIFTSGTTGNPKGVMINQSSIINFIHDIDHRGVFEKETDRVMSVTTPSFDIFGFESFAPLCTGHSIYLADEAEQLDASLVADKIVAHKCTHILSTVSRIKAFVENPYFDKALKQLMVILSGGEHY